MSSVLVVRKSRCLEGRPELPGDKSISHRALMLGALAEGTSRIVNLSPCGDVARTLDALRLLGVQIDVDVDSIVHGVGTKGLGGPPITIDCGDSGTTMRLLAGALVSQDREFVLDGSPQLRRRPMRRITAPLGAMGASIDDAEGRPPLKGAGGTLSGTEVHLQQASAQAGSAVLLAGLNAKGTTVVHYPRPVRDHTERMLQAFGADISWTPMRTELAGPTQRLSCPGESMVVAGDVSAAANLLASATVVPRSRLNLRHVGANPGRVGFLEILQQMGAAVQQTPGPTSNGEPTIDIGIASGCLVGVDVDGPLVSRAVDELPLVAVMGCLARGVTTLRDAAELRVKESDRLATVVDGLRRMGARVQERHDGFAVWGPSRLVGAEVDGGGDHRIVMALAVAGLMAEGETRISGAEAVADSFPGFHTSLAELGADIELVG